MEETIPKEFLNSLRMIAKPMHAVLAVTNDITADQRLQRTAQTLMKRGMRVTVIGRKLAASQQMTFPFSAIRMHMVFRKGPAFYAAYNIRLLLRLLVIRAGLFVANDLDTLPAVFLASRIRRIPLMYDSHELFTGVPELVNRPTVRRIWELLEAMMLPRIRHACTVSPLIARYYFDKYGLTMEVIRNLPESLPDPLPEVPSLRQGTEAIIVYQGALNLGRGLESAIRAIRFTEGIRLVLIGTGDVEEALRQLAERTGVTGKVTFTGRIAPALLPAYTVQADLGISLEEDLGLNYRYALPNKVFDYIRSGIPLLVSDLPMLRAIVESYGIGSIAPSGDPESLAHSFSEMVKGDYKTKYKQLLQAAATELNWEREEPRLLGLIDRALGNQPS